jgi:hypothetical protein
MSGVRIAPPEPIHAGADSIGMLEKVFRRFVHEHDRTV